MRLSPGTGKQDCHVIDFVDSMKRVVGVVSVPTLLGLDPTTVVDGTTHLLTWLSEMLMHLLFRWNDHGTGITSGCCHRRFE